MVTGTIVAVAHQAQTAGSKSPASRRPEESSAVLTASPAPSIPEPGQLHSPEEEHLGRELDTAGSAAEGGMTGRVACDGVGCKAAAYTCSEIAEEESGCRTSHHSCSGLAARQDRKDEERHP
mgnify:CR=1 FL=1